MDASVLNLRISVCHSDLFDHLLHSGCICSLIDAKGIAGGLFNGLRIIGLCYRNDHIVDLRVGCRNLIESLYDLPKIDGGKYQRDTDNDSHDGTNRPGRKTFTS